MRRCTVLLACFSIGGCADVADVTLLGSPMTSRSAQKWFDLDDPAGFEEPLERNLATLPLAGEAARVPWVGSYWPLYLDSINFPWAGPHSESAPHKYQRAFGGTNVEDAVSAVHGIDAQEGALCFTDALCASTHMCARRSGHVIGRCVPFWYGECHAWAAAAILHPEPPAPVIYNGVRFEINDIKALLTLVYNTSTAHHISLRCEDEVNRIEYDGAGRPVNDACRDTNPGTYHLLLANFLGLRGRSFVEDRSMDKDVWNQPLRRYRVYKQQEVTAERANAILGLGNKHYVYNPEAKRFAYMMTAVDFIRESAAEAVVDPNIDIYTFTDVYEYILEMDANGAIIGGEWVGRSKADHPDFVWLPLGPDAVAEAGGAITYDNVMQLLQQSYSSIIPTVPAETN
jgi:hypothetical protein